VLASPPWIPGSSARFRCSHSSARHNRTASRARVELDVEAGTTLTQEGEFGYAMFAVTEGTADVLIDGDLIRTLDQETSSVRSQSFSAVPAQRP
jgi:hypothetical protein